MTPAERLALAWLSLEGLSVGDALGGFFEASGPNRLSHFVRERRPPAGTWHFTDDTNMALSIYENLRVFQQIDQDALAASFITHYDRARGYGRGMRALISRMGKGQHWRETSREFYGGGSYGNGGAMRVAPIGGYFADDMAAVVNNAQASAEITHAHPEGIAGAVAVAVAASVAYVLRDDPATTAPHFIGQVIAHIPPGEVKQGCIQAMEMPLDATTRAAADLLGNGADMSAQRTVPFVLWIAAHYRHDFTEAIWQTLSAGGDADTNCAMVGGIVALSVGDGGIPLAWRNQREPLPDWALG